MSGKIARVWNRNDYPYTETFKGQEITINPGKFIEMEHFEAVEFLGTFTGVKRTADGMPDPRYYKRLSLELTSKDTLGFRQPPKTYRCMACSVEFGSQQELDKHIDDSHTDIIADKESYEEAKKRGRNGGKSI